MSFGQSVNSIAIRLVYIIENGEVEPLLPRNVSDLLYKLLVPLPPP